MGVCGGQRRVLNIRVPKDIPDESLSSGEEAQHVCGYGCQPKGGNDIEGGQCAAHPALRREDGESEPRGTPHDQHARPQEKPPAGCFCPVKLGNIPVQGGQRGDGIDQQEEHDIGGHQQDYLQDAATRGRFPACFTGRRGGRGRGNN